MKKIHVITDSTANIDDDFYAARDNLHKVCLKLRLGAQEYDEDTISAVELFERMKDVPEFPKTSQPPPGEYLAIMRQVVADGGEVIVITVSSGLSGTYQGALAAAKMVDAGKIHVVDSLSAAAGTARLVERTLEMIDSGWETSAILENLARRIALTRTFLLPDSLEYLRRGGRIGGAAALLGTIFQIKPILLLVDGKVTLFDKVRTKKRALKRLLDELTKSGEVDSIGVAYSGYRDEAAAFRDEIAKSYPQHDISFKEASSALTVHAGPGAIALFYQKKTE